MIEQHKYNNDESAYGNQQQAEIALEIFNENSADLKISNNASTLLPTTTSPSSPSLNDQEDFIDEFSSCGIKLSSMPKSVAFAVCATMVTIFYTISGVAQEALFVNYKDFDYGFFLTLVEFAVFTVLSFIQLRIEIATQHKHSGNSTLANDLSNMVHSMKAPVNSYLLLALLSVLGIGLGNESLNYLNFPTKILFKSSKLLVVMVMGVVINRTRYQLLDYLASIFIFFGLIVLYNANQSVSISFEVIGIVLMSSALLADAIAGNLQEKILKSYNASPTELIFYTYLIGTLLLMIMCIVFGQFFSAIQFCMDNPYSIVIMLVFAVTAFIGVQFVHSMTKIFGILITLTTTSCRKVLSILLSFVIFPKPFVTNHLLAVVLVFFGVFLRIYKNKINEILFSFKQKNDSPSHQAPPSSNTSNPHQ